MNLVPYRHHDENRPPPLKDAVPLRGFDKQFSLSGDEDDDRFGGDIANRTNNIFLPRNGNSTNNRGFSTARAQRSALSQSQQNNIMVAERRSQAAKKGANTPKDADVTDNSGGQAAQDATESSKSGKTTVSYKKYKTLLDKCNELVPIHKKCLEENKNFCLIFQKFS